MQEGTRPNRLQKNAKLTNRLRLAASINPVESQSARRIEPEDTESCPDSVTPSGTSTAAALAGVLFQAPKPEH
jgi:hypothetical protein